MQSASCVLPVKRLGNDKNPKLVVLLCNPGGDPMLPKRLPEYAMDKDGVYKDSGMPLDTAWEYNGWWDDFFKIFDKHNLKHSDVLFLEYYPYHTVSSADIPPEKEWPADALKVRDENIALLQKCIKTNAIIFGYYPGKWLNKVRDLERYHNFYKSTAGWKSGKIKELDKFLNKQKDK